MNTFMQNGSDTNIYQRGERIALTYRGLDREFTGWPKEGFETTPCVGKI